MRYTPFNLLRFFFFGTDGTPAREQVQPPPNSGSGSPPVTQTPVLLPDQLSNLSPAERAITDGIRTSRIVLFPLKPVNPLDHYVQIKNQEHQSEGELEFVISVFAEDVCRVVQRELGVPSQTRLIRDRERTYTLEVTPQTAEHTTYQIRIVPNLDLVVNPR